MGEKLEAGEIYKGPCGVLKDSAWLTAETLPTDRDTLVQIEAVIRRREVKFKNETKKGYGSLRFKGKEKELGLCATHIRVLAALFGPDTTNWYGQWIALYVDDSVQAFGQIVSAVRIRAKKVDPSKVARAKPSAATPKPAASDDAPLSEEEMRAADEQHEAENA
jgi:hypothetical protein